MPSISAFRGVRYDLGHVGSLSDVVAPPYDVIDADLQRQLYQRNEHNVVRLILGRDEPGDDDERNRYTRAAQLLRNWQRDGALFTEGDPAIYVYHQVFDCDGTQHTRRGFMCRTRLERFGEGNIHPHEETHAKAKADRLKLWQACRANLSQIFGLYPDPENVAQQLLETAIIGQTPLEATDHLGVVHRLWPVTDVAVITQLIGAMGPLPVFIADGHHRYETACNYRDALAADDGSELPPDHPANFVLMMCVSMSDPGMLVLPTHRLFRGLPPITSDELIERLGDCFDAHVESEPVGEAGFIWSLVESEAEQGRLAFHTRADGKWVVADINDVGSEKLKQVAADRSDEWRGLGVSILHRLVIDTLLDAPNLPAPKYVHSVDELVAGIEQGDDDGRDATGQQGTCTPFELAVMVMPATLDHIRAISAAGERMPPKSTYFYPKVLSGLVINPLE
jgi:uncharacterized protein (DUF1015 family)